jgi:hypothetical protein
VSLTTLFTRAPRTTRPRLQSPIETERVRKVILYFYLEDDSIHIAEARTENSGLPQVWCGGGTQQKIFPEIFALSRFFQRFLFCPVSIYARPGSFLLNLLCVVACIFLLIFLICQFHDGEDTEVR